MRQVPTNRDLLIIGSGRLASHLCFYFDKINLPFRQWSRKYQTTLELSEALEKSKNILLCISDDQIEPFYSENKLSSKNYIHFSGAFHHPEILGFHPLMTFSFESYEQSVYENFYFVGEASEEIFRTIFPHLNNPYVVCPKENKAFYHALCTLGGNGTTLLWKLILTEAEKLDLKPEIFRPFIQQIFTNLFNQSPGLLTGPWYRKDFETIDRHHKELSQSHLLPLYEAFQNEAMKREQTI